MIDPESGEEVRLFNPRVDGWSDHFEWHGVSILGRTIVGRATVHALRLNRGLALAVRNEEKLAGRHRLNQPSCYVEASTDLSGWSKVAAITKISGTLVFEDAGADQHESRYYRVVTTP